MNSVEVESGAVVLEPYRGLTRGADLAAMGLLVAEGRLVIERAISAAPERILSVLGTARALRALESALGHLPSTTPVWRCSQEALDQLVDIRFHQGCLALAHRPASPPWSTTLSSATRMLVFEGVANPDNLGAVLRSGLAFGVDAVLLGPACADPFYRKTLRASMGAAFRLPIHQCPERAAFVQRLGEMSDAGWQVVALTPRADAACLEELPRPSGPCAVLVGAEGSGLSEQVLSAVSTWARIPTSDAVDSLNLSVAAGICLYKLFA